MPALPMPHIPPTAAAPPVGAPLAAATPVGGHPGGNA